MWAHTNNDVSYLSGRRGTAAEGVAKALPQAMRSGLNRFNPLLWLRSMLARETVRQELYGMDDRSLADLGINQGDFPAILRGTYRREN